MQQVTLSATTLPFVAFEKDSVRGTLNQAQAWDQLACTRACAYGVRKCHSPSAEKAPGGIQQTSAEVNTPATDSCFQYL